MLSLHPRPEIPLRIDWYKSVSCWCYSWCNKRLMFYLFSATMPKPLQDYQVVVPCCCHKEDKSHHTSCDSGSSRQRRSHWIFFYTPIQCRTSPTSTKSNQNWIIVQSHAFPISLPFLTTPNFLKWSLLVIHDPIRRSYPDIVLWSASTTHCPITSQFPRLFPSWLPLFFHPYRSPHQ